MIYFIYFFSIGYGFGIAALALAIAILFNEVLTLSTTLLCAVMFLFGCRLGLYLLTREKRSAEYKKILYGPDAAKKKPVFVVIMVWIFCALLYHTLEKRPSCCPSFPSTASPNTNGYKRKK